jgi:hypothetical protein
MADMGRDLNIQELFAFRSDKHTESPVKVGGKKK